jgi:hypothetical protein
MTGEATLVTSALSVGSHSITAGYSGSDRFVGSTSAVLTQVVNRAPTTNIVASSLNPCAVGQSVTFTAIVTSAAAVLPSGSITFKDGTNNLGTIALNAAGQAMLTTSALSLGTHSITAVYGGDASFAPNTSAVLSQVVQVRYPTSAKLSSGHNPSVYGQAVTLNAAVISTGPDVPSGTVTFWNGATALPPPVKLNASGQASLTISLLPAGTNSLTAIYSGSKTCAASTSAPLVQTVTPAPTTTSVVSKRNPSTLGQQVTFAARVTSDSGVPTGTVTFRDGTRELATLALTEGVATWGTNSLSSGSHSITATFNGSANLAPSTSTAIIQVVR